MFLTNMAGPLPVWGWGAIAGGGVLLLSAGGKKKPPPDDPNAGKPPVGAPGASQAFMYGGSGNIYGSAFGDPFGGGALGMYSYPYFGGSNMFVNLFRHHHHDSWRYGGHGFPFHAFDRIPFFGGDGDRDDRRRNDHDRDDRGRNFGHGDGDRGRSFANDPYQYPRGGGGGRFGPGGEGGPSSRFRDNNASSPGNHVR